jgi:murein L,D-transpeptidase YcbB/YkuD
MRRVLTIVALLFGFLYSGVSQAQISSLKTPYKSLISQMYAQNGNNYFWVNHPAALAKVVNALNNGYYNYKNKEFNRNKITQYVYALDSGSLSQAQMDKLDLMVTDAFIRLLHFVRVGDVRWSLVQKKIKSLRASHDIKAAWEMKIKGMPSASTILRYIRSGRVNAILQDSITQKSRYKAFIDILQYYRKIPEFRKVPFGKTIKYGQRDKRVYQIKRKLLILGYFPRSGSINRKFDRNLAFAIKMFRRSFNLREGAYIDNKLIGYLNLPKSYYIKKIIVNLDKTKVFPNFGSTFVEVNVPEFMMRFYQNGVEVFKTPAVVGMITRPTPIFSDMLEYIVVNPTWTVPESLIKKDLIPALKSHPDVFKTAHLKAYQGGKEVKPDIQKILNLEGTNRHSPYRIVQMPGDHNALGRIKFMFPNKYAVYLHDTPEKGLFAHRYRYNSSGCMRLEDPQGFLDYLRPYLGANVDSALNSGKTKRVNLKQKIPVHVVYFTLEFENGSPKFLYDAYLYDKMIEESTAGNIKYGFDVPSVRLKEVYN